MNNQAVTALDVKQKPAPTKASLFTKAAHLDTPQIKGKSPARRPSREELSMHTPAFVQELEAAYLISAPLNTGRSFSKEHLARVAEWKSQQMMQSPG